MALSAGADREGEPAPRLRIDQREIDCGLRWKGSRLTHTFLVHNDGSAQLLLERLQPS